jgi:hypothetical protein
VEGDQPHAFDTDVAIERGDLVALVAISGSALGARPGVAGATTERWVPRLSVNRPPDFGPGTGFDEELLFRVEYIADAQQRIPDQVTGAEARGLRPGRVRERHVVRFKGGRTFEEALVELDGRFVLDQFVDGRRTARIGVPDFQPKGGRVITFEVAATGTKPPAVGIYLEYANADSARILSHYYGSDAREFEFVN